MAKKRKSLEVIQKEQHIDDYQFLFDFIIQRIKSGELKVIKASGINGKKPALYNEYWEIQEKAGMDENEIELLTYKLHSSLDASFYIKNPDKYKKDSVYIKLLNAYLKEQKEKLSLEMTINERSFDIFRREKFIKQEGGKTLLNRLKLPENALHYYETSEPLAYYSKHKNTPQNMLVIENKDTFFSMRKYLNEGGESIFGKEIGTLIYGGGKAVFKSFADFESGVEEYFSHPQNTVWYFGDLDYEGILIYELLREEFFHAADILVFKRAYERLLLKAERYGFDRMPEMKEQQNKHIRGSFLEQFDAEQIKKIKELLETGRYIPQEMVNASDYGDGEEDMDAV